ncbi:MAG: DUF1294 domain-containing protein [Burkholderiaceae bacterium]|nr:DUF1294 domain-containing protein [Roseateles sp.]MBV8470377.1 DUF1294 domain-containing protein [Burkholderiaceae bacterium]
MRLGEAILIVYGLMSQLSFCVYGFDKLAARQGWRRVRERRLHWLALLGGWPGAWLAQQVFRHKTAKAPFRRWFWLTVVLNMLVLGAVVVLNQLQRL